MWVMVQTPHGFLLKYNGQVVAINSGDDPMHALLDFGTIVANVSQAVPA